ncbi:hypothetical protein NDI44_06190 [Trichocoleus sp. DQ-A3]|nr:hypothetical protein [Coleofasciculus sp. FACHB-125]MBD1901261.1 hypothetical protein [Coleofasciculus sp. FACHB-125]
MKARAIATPAQISFDDLADVPGKELSINTERTGYLIQKLLFYTLVAGVAQG